MRFVKYFVLILSLFLIPNISNSACFVVSSSDGGPCAYGSHCNCTLNKIINDTLYNTDYCADHGNRPILFWDGFQTSDDASGGGENKLTLKIPVHMSRTVDIIGSSVKLTSDQCSSSCDGYSMGDYLRNELSSNFLNWFVEDDGISFGEDGTYIHTNDEFEAHVGRMSKITLKMHDSFAGNCSKIQSEYQISGGSWYSTYIIAEHMESNEKHCPPIMNNANLNRVSIKSDVLTTLVKNSYINGLFINLESKDFKYGKQPLLHNLKIENGVDVTSIPELKQQTTFRISKSAATHMNELYRKDGVDCGVDRPRYLKEGNKCMLLFDPKVLAESSDDCKQYYKIELLKDSDDNYKIYQIRNAGEFQKYSSGRNEGKYSKYIGCDDNKYMYVLNDGKVLKELSTGDTANAEIFRNVTCHLPFPFRPVAKKHYFYALCDVPRGYVYPEIGYVFDDGIFVDYKFKSRFKNAVGDADIQSVTFVNPNSCSDSQCTEVPENGSDFKMVDDEGRINRVKFLYNNSKSPFTLYLDVLGNQRRVEISDQSVDSGYIVHRGYAIAKAERNQTNSISIVQGKEQILLNRANYLYDEYGRKVDFALEQEICEQNKYYPVLNVGFVEGGKVKVYDIYKSLCHGGSCEVPRDLFSNNQITFLAQCKCGDGELKQMCFNEEDCYSENEFYHKILSNNENAVYGEYGMKCVLMKRKALEIPFERAEVIINKSDGLDGDNVELEEGEGSHSEKLLEDVKNNDVKNADSEDVDAVIRKSVSMSKVDKKALINDGPVQRARTGGCALNGAGSISLISLFPVIIFMLKRKKWIG